MNLLKSLDSLWWSNRERDSVQLTSLSPSLLMRSNMHLTKIQDYGWKPMIQEYLPGLDDEFTSGVTIDKNGTYTMSSIAIRKYLKGGQTYKAFIDDYPIVRLSAENVAEKLGVTGAVNIQAKYVPNEESPSSSTDCSSI